ncbi:hypothetical protein [Siccibacter turicensis]|uniref:hypothetical protein n=1 Tax=Siccibacter turicensis TaxID=357233 RepID=UPI003F555CFC
MHNNEKVLRAIEHDLSMWKRGWPPTWMMLSYVPGIVLAVACILLFPGEDALLTVLVFPGTTFLLVQACSHLMKKWFPSWPDILNRKLTLYEPKSMQAWDILCGHVREKKMLTPDDVTAWLLAEKASDVNGGAGRYSFLNTETGEQSDERKH